MRLKQEFATRESANKKAADLRKTYASVVVFPIGGRFGSQSHKGPFGVAYDEKTKRTKESKK